MIVTSSLGVLQAGGIQFYPKMEPEWFEALQRHLATK